MKPSIALQAVCGCLLLALRGSAEGLSHQASLRRHPPRSLLNYARSVTNVSANFSAFESAIEAPNGQPKIATGAEDGDEQRELIKIHEIEETLISLKADKAAGRITPGMESFVKMVNGIIKEEMMPKIEAGHKSAVGMLASIHSGFEGCGTHRSVAKAAIATLSTTKTSARNSHTTCRVKESAAYVDRAQCFAVVKEKMRLRDIACKAYKQMLKNPDDDADNCHTSASAEPYGAWLKRNRNWFEQKNAQIKKTKGNCEQAKLNFEQVQGPCNKKKVHWLKQKAKCNTKQHRLEMSSCTLSKKTMEMCGSYTDCYGKQHALYSSQVPLIKTQEKDRKTEWRALKRIECLLTEVFGSDVADEKEIQECTAKKYDASHLNLKYPRKPYKDRSACLPVPPVPGSRSFNDIYYKGMPKGTRPVRPRDECVVDPGAGMRLYVARMADESKCKVDGEWLSAENGGSCLVAGKGGYPVVVDYTKKRFTRYRFTMKMKETNTRDGIQEGGGFAVCNRRGTSSERSSSPAVVFRDSVPSQWGYHLSNFDKPDQEAKVAKCADLLVKYQVWGKEAVGLDVSKYTGGSMKWIGCNGDGCTANSFFCQDDLDREGIVFGSRDPALASPSGGGALRALLGKEVPATASEECCSPESPSAVCNAMEAEKDIQALCENLGYTSGVLLEQGPSNKCPQVSFDWKEMSWTSSFTATGGPGKKFRCQGPLSEDLYTDKAHYKASEPKESAGKTWDLVMEYKDDRYKFRSLEIEGVSYDGYKGMVSQCSTDSTKAKIYFGFTPRLETLGSGRVWMKDFRIFQGDDLDKPMKQIVGIGFGEKAVRRKEEKEEANKAIKKHIAKLNRQEKDEVNDPGLRNDMVKVADWTDKESLCTSEMAKKNLFGTCAKIKSDRVGIWIKYANGLEGFAAYDGVGELWNKGSFKRVEASVSTGFFSKCRGLHFLGEDCTGVPMAWVGCQNKFSDNFDLDYSPKKCSDWRASKPGWVTARIRLYCKM